MNMDYRSSGVDIDKGDMLSKKVGEIAAETHDERVVGGIGGFGAVYDLSGFKHPMLVSSTDGIGTKLLLAREYGKIEGLGFDLVGMCADDVICSGAKPMYFLDYIATGRLDEGEYLTLINSIAQACRLADCALTGGETAEMPGMYQNSDFDVAGFCVGLVEKDQIITKKSVRNGDVLIGLGSTGFHSNGYSLIRNVIEKKSLDLKYKIGYRSLGDCLLEPTAVYSSIITEALEQFQGAFHGIAHITGGGIPGNLMRVINPDQNAVVHKNSWKLPKEMSYIIEQGNIDNEEAFRVFNMGVGMVLIVDESKSDSIYEFFRDFQWSAMKIGNIESGKGNVVIQ